MPRWVVPGLVILGLSVSHVGCILDGCYELRRRGFDFDVPADAQLQFQIDRCRLDVETCIDLCALALARAEQGGEIKECVLRVYESRAHVDVAWKVYIDGPQCDHGDVNVPSDF